MIRGLYTAATGMIHQRDRLNTIANNLSNINTKGYKRDDMLSHSFKDELLIRTGGHNKNPKALGPLNHGVYAERVTAFHRDGPMQRTDLMTDIALQGNGFFTVLRDDNELYTRDGSFRINAQGILTTMEGHMVAGDYGSIYLGQEDFEIDPEGYIWQGDTLVNRLNLIDFGDTNQLEKVGDNLFSYNGDTNSIQEFEGQIFQYYIENSDINLVDEMNDMIIVARGYEANQRILQMTDNTLAKAVNEIGSI